MPLFIRMEVVASVRLAKQLRQRQVLSTHGSEQVDDVFVWHATLLADFWDEYRQSFVYYCLVEFEFVVGDVEWWWDGQEHLRLRLRSQKMLAYFKIVFFEQALVPLVFF